MSEFQLQARRAVTGCRPRREETRLAEADCLDSAMASARELAEDGFRVWVFRRSDRPRITAAPQPLRLVTTLDPTGSGPRARGAAADAVLSERARPAR